MYESASVSDIWYYSLKQSVFLIFLSWYSLVEGFACYLDHIELNLYSILCLSFPLTIAFHQSSPTPVFTFSLSPFLPPLLYISVSSLGASPSMYLQHQSTLFHFLTDSGTRIWYSSSPEFLAHPSWKMCHIQEPEPGCAQYTDTVPILTLRWPLAGDEI